MPCELLIAAVDNPNGAKYQKGDIKDVRDDDQLAVHPWGALEDLPRSIRVRITNATAAEVEGYLSEMKDVINYELVNSNAQGRRYRLYVHPKILTNGGSFRAGIRDLLQDEYNATLVSADLPNGEVTLDIPNTDWQAMRVDILDKFESVVRRRRYRFTDSAVDTAIANNGRATITKAQAIANIVDRLE